MRKASEQAAVDNTQDFDDTQIVVGMRAWATGSAVHFRMAIRDQDLQLRPGKGAYSHKVDDTEAKDLGHKAIVALDSRNDCHNTDNCSLSGAAIG